MRNEYKKLFNHLTPPDPPEDLLKNILHRIGEEKRIFVLKRRIVILWAGCFGSAAAFVPVFHLLKVQLVESGFFHFASLFASDPYAVTAFWDEFILSMLESLPVASVAILLSPVFIFLGSFRYLARDLERLA
ncbi:MAG: hypothetical protein HY001_00780 [Candidatus Portnoybacteria bacterium]|nr:hypothetical protein [Candidatus Portnoybacteria bacterium]